MTASQPGDELDLEQAAEYLNISPNQLTELSKSGKAPATKEGDSWRFHRSALAEYAKKGDSVRTVKVAECKHSRQPEPEEMIDEQKRAVILDSLRGGSSVIQAALKVSVSPRTLTQLCDTDDELNEAVRNSRHD